MTNGMTQPTREEEFLLIETDGVQVHTEKH